MRSEAGKHTSTLQRSVACVVSPNARDAELAVDFLAQNGIEARWYPSLPDLAPAMDETTGCVIIVEEALAADDLSAFHDALGRLPAWSDLPLIIVSSNLAAVGDVTASAFPDSGNVTLLERPLNPHALISAVKVALRASARQVQVGELIFQREQAVKLRDEFLAMLAHELRNPLAPMRNALYVMRRAKVDDPLLLKNTEILERQVNHMVRMVDDLMDVARLERGKVALKKQRVDLNRIVAAAVEMCLPMAQQRGHQVNLRFGTNALPVDGDTVRIEQVIWNLLNNATKFSPRPDEISVETSVQGQFAVVSVTDQGIGFDPERAAQLFEPFLQVSQTLERSAGGLGMGLTIVKRLTELHGGSVEAKSEGPGKGASFTVRLPLAAESTGAQEPPVSEPSNVRRRRIVLIEDNPDIRETVGMLMTMWGHDVAMANDGRTGIDLILKQQPDFALVDIGLPGMNGYEVAQAIRRELPRSKIRLIAVTGYGQPRDRELAEEAGFDLHLLKPILPDVLQNLLLAD